MSTVSKGKRGELVAQKFIISKGYKILALNFRTETAEIDMIAEDKDTVVFIEVKSRSHTGFGMGRESVDFRKRNKIVQAAQMYLIRNKSLDSKSRFDVIEVNLNTEQCTHIISAFFAEE